jgi:membrane-bound lytic murein transglycosylase B
VPIRAPAPRFHSGDPSFDIFLEDMRAQALKEGVTGQAFDRVASTLKPLPDILKHNANQPEFTRTIWDYLDSAVSARRIREGKAKLADYANTLDRIEAASGVPKAILVAIWGMETDYGAVTGGYPLFGALATLAYKGPRQTYARPEFLAALKIYQQQHYALDQMQASWAGAFGQTQFTPTTFLKYAVDGDGDGRINLWNDPADALASAANLLNQRGWARDQSWGYEVRLPGNFAYEQADGHTTRTIAAWRELGVTTTAGARLPDASEEASIYLPAGAQGPAFLLLPNFNVILKYNNAASYALAVGLLADRLRGADGLYGEWPRDTRALARDERIRIQESLAKLGFDPGPIDGVLGKSSRAALRRYQKAHDLPADGFATQDLLQRLTREAALQK